MILKRRYKMSNKNEKSIDDIELTEDEIKDHEKFGCIFIEDETKRFDIPKFITFVNNEKEDENEN